MAGRKMGRYLVAGLENRVCKSAAPETVISRNLEIEAALKVLERGQ